MKRKSIKYRRSEKKALYILICSLVVIALIPFLSVIWTVCSKGFTSLNLHFFYETIPDSMRALLAKGSGEQIPGGIANALSGGLFIISIAILISLPIGLGTGIYLFEHNGCWLTNLIRTTCNILHGTPSLIIGVIVYLWIVVPLHSYSALAGGIALAIVMIPLIVFATENALKKIPQSLIEASCTTGGYNYLITRKIYLPLVYKKIIAGIVYAINRALGETAPLLFTALGTTLINWDLFKPTTTLPLLIWDIFEIPGLVDFLWGASFILVLISIVLNLISTMLWKNSNPL